MVLFTGSQLQGVRETRAPEEGDEQRASANKNVTDPPKEQDRGNAGPAR